VIKVRGLADVLEDGTLENHSSSEALRDKPWEVYGRVDAD